MKTTFAAEMTKLRKQAKPVKQRVPFARVSKAIDKRAYRRDKSIPSD